MGEIFLRMVTRKKNGINEFFFFLCQTLADEFYSTYNAIPFNSIEDYVCHLVYVAKVESVKTGEVNLDIYLAPYAQSK